MEHDNYTRLVKQYRANPKNVFVCKALYNEYVKLGMHKNAVELAQWIERLKNSKKKSGLKVAAGYSSVKASSFSIASFKDNFPLQFLLWVSIALLVVLSLASLFTGNPSGIGLGIVFAPINFIFGVFVLLPSIVAFERHIQPKWGCFILNLFTFWTIVIWIACLIWAVSCAGNGDKKL